MLSIRRLTTSPHHPVCNGLVDNAQWYQWHCFINPLLFVYREVRQEATEFPAFELLYRRTVRGPVQVRKELWSIEENVPEVLTSYQYVFELRKDWIKQ